MEHPSGPVLAWSGHPATVVATVVLPVNDHVLKALWPGLLTGKLSDVAGLLVAPPVLTLALVLMSMPVLALLRAGSLLPALTRVAAPVATVVTGAGFTAVKVTQEGAEFASRVWSTVAIPSRMLADPTDLLALPALGAAWLIWRRCGEDRPVRRFRALVVVPVALVGVTATSPVPPPVAVDGVFARDGIITVTVDNGTELSSRDGGHSWTVSPARGSGSGEPVPSATPHPGSTVPAPSPRPGTATRACLPDDPLHCYRVDPPRLAVHETLDGGDGWNTVWAISEGRQDALRRKAEEDPRVGWRGSTAIAVQPVPGGHVVVAANGHDGIALRDTRGNWRRLGLSDGGFSPEAAPSLTAPRVDLRAERQTGVLAGLLCFMVGVTMARRHGQGPAGVPAYVLVSVTYLITFPGGDSPNDLFPMSLFLLFGGALLLVPAVISMIATAVRARMPVSAWLALTAIACVTPFSIWMIFSGWESGLIDRYPVAGFLGWVVAGLGMAASVLVGRAARRTAGTAGERARTPPRAGSS
ncbi:hypothetical protein [Streptosporangium longisporum]|uniref:ABC transporter permease n=1 Tax=Streptosporangium longisporum TaxID=46187 RepID=A0ABP6KFM8_9ACTN